MIARIMLEERIFPAECLDNYIASIQIIFLTIRIDFPKRRLLLWLV